MLGTAAVGKEEYPIYILNIVISFFPDARLEKSFVAKLHFKHIYHLAFHFHDVLPVEQVEASDVEQCVGSHACCQPLFTV